MRFNPLNLSAGVNNRVASDSKFAKFVYRSVIRHFQRDWGDCCPEDNEQNNQALIDGSRLFSVYKYNDKEKIWVISESVPYRHITTVLFPQEY